MVISAITFTKVRKTCLFDKARKLLIKKTHGRWAIYFIASKSVFRPDFIKERVCANSSEIVLQSYSVGKKKET